MKSKILILGSQGLLGSSLCRFLEQKHIGIVKHSRNTDCPYQADLSDKKQVADLFMRVEAEVIVNLVALADVDACEIPDNAYKSNVQVVENIIYGLESKKCDRYLLHISTDQVYDGEGYHIEDDIHLTNYYAFSKYAGELVVSRVNGCSLRTNFFGLSYSSAKKSLTDWLYSSLNNGDAIKVFNDVFFNPLSMFTLSSKIEKITEVKPKGVFNLGSRNGMSKADFAFSFAEELNLPTKNMKRVSIDDVDFIKTYRSRDMRMDVNKIERVLGDIMPFLSDEIKLVAEEYKNV